MWSDQPETHPLFASQPQLPEKEVPPHPSFIGRPGGVLIFAATQLGLAMYSPTDMLKTFRLKKLYRSERSYNQYLHSCLSLDGFAYVSLLHIPITGNLMIKLGLADTVHYPRHAHSPHHPQWAFNIGSVLWELGETRGGGNPMRKRPRQHVNCMYEPVEQTHCEKWKFSTARIFIILAFNIVFKCVQIFIYLSIAILFNLQCTTQLSLSLSDPHLPSPMEIVFFTTGCFLLTVLQQLHRFLNSYRTWELLTHKKLWNRELGSCKTERLQYSRSIPTVQFGHFGRCWKVVGFFSMHPRKV